MKLKNSYPGINIQYPYSRLIVEGKKTVETRTYPLPENYLNKELALIETPGKSRDFIARIIGIIKITNCFRYKTKEVFNMDFKKHLVEGNSKWDWRDKPKWGWEILVIKKLKNPREIKYKKGIVFTKEIFIEF